jgi:hypothetical protein
MITIGSVIAMLLAGLNEVGFISFAVDSVVDWVEDNPDRNPYLPECEEDWLIIADHYIVDGDLYVTVDILDQMWCNSVHTVYYNLTFEEEQYSEMSAPFRNTDTALFEFYDIEEGTHRINIIVENGTILLYALEIIDFEYDAGEEENAIYGCTDEAAINYNETATHEDGSCEYPEEEEEITEDCYAYIYDAISYWAENNTSVYNEFDVDFSCQANITFTMKIELLDSHNETLGQIEDNFTTYHMEWDSQYLDFYNVGDNVDGAYAVNINLFYDGELADTLWKEIA